MEILVTIVLIAGLGFLVVSLVAAGATGVRDRWQKRAQAQRLAAMRRTKEVASSQIAHLHRAYRTHLTDAAKAHDHKEHRPR